MKLNLKTIVVNATQAEFDFHACPGMSVTIAYANKALLNSLKEQSMIQKFDTETGTPYKDLDVNVYLAKYIGAVVKGWKGFTGAHLASLVLINEDDIDLGAEIDFDAETAEFLMKESSVFDAWVVATAKTLANFRPAK